MARYSERATLLASAARTASAASERVTVPDSAEGVVVFIDATAVTDTPSVVFTIQGYDEVADDYYDILASAAVATISFRALRVGQGLTAAANLVSGDAVPRVFRVNAVNADSDSITYSVGYRTWRRP